MQLENKIVTLIIFSKIFDFVLIFSYGDSNESNMK